MDEINALPEVKKAAQELRIMELSKGGRRSKICNNSELFNFLVENYGNGIVKEIQEKAKRRFKKNAPSATRIGVFYQHLSAVMRNEHVGSKPLGSALNAVSDMGSNSKEPSLKWEETDTDLIAKVGFFQLRAIIDSDPHYDCWDCLIVDPDGHSDIYIPGDRYKTTTEAQLAAEGWLLSIGTSIISSFSSGTIIRPEVLASIQSKILSTINNAKS